MKLPKMPDLEEATAAFRKTHKFKILKWINTGSVEFVSWLKSGDLELKAYNEIETVGDGIFSAEVTATIAIDAKHHATLKSVVKKEGFE